MKSQASRAIEKGFTPRVMKSVTHRTAPVLGDALERLQVDLQPHRDDHQLDAATGRLIRAASTAAIAWKAPGAR
jgi:hypothetical protein